jgi:hypothetical protein
MFSIRDDLVFAASSAVACADLVPVGARLCAALPANPAAYEAIQQSRCRRGASNCGLFCAPVVLGRRAQMSRVGLVRS